MFCVSSFYKFQNTRHQWQIIFYISACIFFAGAVLYALLSEGEEQPWARQGSGGQGKLSSARDATHDIHDSVLIVGPPSSGGINS